MMEEKFLNEARISGNYNKVIDYANDLSNNLGFKDVHDICIALFIEGDYKAALNILYRRRDELEKNNLIETMMLFFEVAFLLEDFVLLEKEKKHYLELPYRSQEIEQKLKNIDEIVEICRLVSLNLKELYFKKFVSIETIKDYLLSNDKVVFLKGISYAIDIKKEDRSSMNDFILDLAKKETEFVFKLTYFIQYLIEFKIDATLRFFKFNQLFEIKTSDYFDVYPKILKKLEERLNFIAGILTIKSQELFVMMNYLEYKVRPYLFPEFLTNLDVDSYIMALYIMSNKKLEEELENDKLIEQLNFKENSIETYMNLIQKVFENEKKLYDQSTNA